MAFCHICGAKLGEADKFCGSCGTKVSETEAAACAEPAEQAEQTEVAAENAADEAITEAALDSLSEGPNEAAVLSAAETQAIPPVSDAATEQTQPADSLAAPVPPALEAPTGYENVAYGGAQQVPPASPYAAPEYAAYVQPEKGALAKAWADFMAAPKKLMVALKLALAMFLPGANLLILEGYTCHWGKDAALGRKSPMPEKLIRPGVLDSGLYAYLTSFIYAIVFFVAFYLIAALFSTLNIPSAITLLLLLAATVVYVPIMYAAQTRAIICGRVRDGLNVSAVVDEVFKQGKFGKMFVASYVPMIIACVACVVVALIFSVLMTTAITMFGSLPHAGSTYASYAYVTSVSLTYQLRGVASVVVAILLCIMLFIIFFIFVGCALVSERAMGYVYEEFQPQNWAEYKENSERLAKEAL